MENEPSKVLDKAEISTISLEITAYTRIEYLY